MTSDDWMKQPTLPANLGVLVDEAAEENPNAMAWRFIETGSDVTFAQLRDYSNRAANLFFQLGIRHATHVAMMSSNSLAYCGGWLALAKLGAVVVSVNTRYTARELLYVLADAEVEFVVIEASFLAVFEDIESVPPRIPP